jgi:hypothetical protein
MLSLLLAGCLPKHPDEALRREARRQDERLRQVVADVVEDDAYAVSQDEVLAATVGWLGGVDVVFEASPTGAGTDWRYDGAPAVDEVSEYLDQRRARRTVAIATTGPESRVAATDHVEVRRARPATVGQWSTTETPADPSDLVETLADAEVRALGTLRATGDALQAFATTLPNGFEVAERTAERLRAESVESSLKKGKTVSAIRETRDTCTATVTGGAVAVRHDREHRYLVGDQASEWESTGTGDALVLDWTAAALRAGFATGALTFAPHPAVHVAARSLSAPPALPRLRTREEVVALVTQRALEQGRGRFSMCLDYVVVDPHRPDGFHWDGQIVGFLTDTVSFFAGGTEQLAGELAAAAEQDALTGLVVNKGVQYLTGVKPQQLEAIAGLTRQLTDFTAELLPLHPDLRGQVAVGGRFVPLRPTDDALQSEQHLCAVSTFRGPSDGMRVQLVDADIDGRFESVGDCAVGLGDVLTHGPSGTRCGSATLFTSAEFQFDLDQVALLGLPPPDPNWTHVP